MNTYQTTTRLGGGIQSEWYVDHTDLNEAAATKTIDLAVTEPIQITPRFSLGLFGSFVESNDAVRRNELTQAPAPDLPPSEAIVTERTKSRDYRGSIRMGYLLTPRVDVSLGGGVSKREFTGDTAGVVTGGISLEDSTSVNGDAALYYAITPRFSSGVFVNAGFNSFEVRPNSETYTAGLTGRYRLTALHTLTARAGATYLTESSNVPGQDDETWSPYGSLALAYTKGGFLASLRGTYEIVGAGSFGEVTKRGSVALAMTDQFAERWWWDCGGFFQNNRSSQEPLTVDFTTVQGRVGIRYVIADWASLFLRGTIARQRSEGTRGADIDRESAFLGVNLSAVKKLY
jgi:hypothetical protein